MGVAFKSEQDFSMLRRSNHLFYDAEEQVGECGSCGRGKRGGWEGQEDCVRHILNGCQKLSLSAVGRLWIDEFTAQDFLTSTSLCCVQHRSNVLAFGRLRLSNRLLIVPRCSRAEFDRLIEAFSLIMSETGRDDYGLRSSIEEGG